MVRVNQSPINNFFSKYRPALLQKNEVVIRQEEEIKHLFFIKSGRVTKSIISPKGEELILNTFTYSQLFPVSGIFAKNISSYYYIAPVQSILIKAPLKDFSAFLKSNPEVMFELLNQQCELNESLLQKTFYMMTGGAKSRLLAQILSSVKNFGSNKKSLSIQRSQKEIAMSTGLSRETVSRELSILKQKNLIDIRKKTITIINLKHFELELAESLS